jgi:formylglycine-generating enzyme required for sulfatase activity
MTDDLAALEATRREVQRLRRTLEALSLSQEGQRGRIAERLVNAQLEVETIEARLQSVNDDTPDLSPISERERIHLSQIVERYSAIAGVYGDLSIRGQAQRTNKRLTVAATHFVDLHHQVYNSLTHSLDSDDQSAFRVDTFNELFRSIVATNPRIALIGDPGSGKSTTLGRLAYEYGRRTLAAEVGPIPVILDLAAMASGETFTEALRRAEREALGEGLVTERPTIVMIDGLNETSHDVVGQIVNWLREHPRTQTIVACRRIDYLDRTLPLRRIDILPLDVGQIHSFIGQFLEDELDRSRLFWGLAGAETNSVWRWFRKNDSLPTFDNFWYGSIGHPYSYEIERTRIGELQAEAGRTTGCLPGVLEVVRNPFLLYVAIIAYVNNENLPESRSELLRSFSRIMIERGDWSGSGVYDQRYPNSETAGAERAEYLLKDMAFEITREGFSTGVDSDWLDGFLNERVDQAGAKAFIAGSKRSGVLEWSGTTSAIVRFRHQLIQEYFASLRLGERLHDGASASEFWPSASWWEVTPWDEVALFLAGATEDASELVRWLTPVNPSLAYRCATAPGVRCDVSALRSLYEPEVGARACPMARARWGRLLNDAGDMRQGVLLDQAGLPQIEWIEVPAGQYTVGGDDSLRDLGLHLPETLVEIPAAFYIAKFPITYSQFDAFVRLGYRNDKYWTADGLEWRGEQKCPRLWNADEYHFANHPVVGVTWYEAVAFTNWLSETVHGAGGSEWTISLPTDAEWEVACRYPDGRRYAWGNLYTPGIANIDETYQGHNVGPYFIRQTTAVGLYESGRSALGAYDMCGNVWEWSLSKWDAPYQPPEDVSMEGTEHRVVRGNSWYNSVRFAPAAAHDCLDPDFGVNDTGLRVIRRKRRGKSGG